MLHEKKVEIVLFNDAYVIIKRKKQLYIELVASIECKRNVANLNAELLSGQMVISRIDSAYKIIQLQSDNIWEEIANIHVYSLVNHHQFEEQIISLENVSVLLKSGKIEIGILDDMQIFYHYRTRNVFQILAYNSICLQNLAQKLTSNEITIINMDGKQSIVEQCESDKMFKILSHVQLISNQHIQVANTFLNDIKDILKQQGTNVKILEMNGQQILSKYDKDGNIINIIAIINPFISNVMERIDKRSIDIIEINGFVKLVENNFETGMMHVVATICKKEMEFEIGQYILLNIDDEYCIARNKDKNSFEIIAKTSFIEVSSIKEIPTVYIPINKT